MGSFRSVVFRSTSMSTISLSVDDNIYIYIYIYIYITWYCLWPWFAIRNRRTEWRSFKKTITMLIFLIWTVGLFVYICVLLNVNMCIWCRSFLHMCIYLCMYWYAYLHIYTYFRCLLVGTSGTKEDSVRREEWVREDEIYCCNQKLFFFLTLW